MTSLRKFSIVLLVVAALAGLMAAPAQAQLSLNCSQSDFPNSMNVGTNYSMPCSATGGTAPYGFTATGDVSDWGMQTYQAGAEYSVQGRPIGAGTYHFTLTVTDSGTPTALTASQSFTITVSTGGGTGSGSITLSSISPSTLTAGYATQISLFGANFTPSSVVIFNGSQLGATYVGTTQLNVTLPAYLVVAGTLSVYVRDPSNGTSGTQYVTVTSSGSSGSLSLTQISPTSTPLNTAFTLTLFGSGFSGGILLNFGSVCTLSTQFVSSGELLATVPSNCLTVAQTVNVSVGGSNTQPFTIGGSGSSGSITLGSVSPTVLPPGIAATLYLYGSNFTFNSIVHFNNATVQTSFQNSGYLIASIPSYLVTSGSLPVYVSDATTGTSTTVSVSVSGSGSSGIITLSQVSPSSLTAGVQTQISVFGTNFTYSSTVYFNGNAVSTSYQNSGYLIATIPGTLITSGSLAVYVYDPTNGTSATTFVSVSGSGSGGTLSLGSISPTSAAVGSAALQLTLFGSGFSSGILLNFGSVCTIGTTFVSSTELLATIPASPCLATAQTVSVSVGGSNSVQFVIGGSTGSSGSIVLSSVSPTVLTAGTTTTLYVYGANFTGNSLIHFNNVTVQTTYLSTGQLYATIPGSYVTSGSLPVYVTDPSTGTSITTYVSVGGSGATGIISLTSVSPNTMAAGTAATLYAFGGNFTASSLIHFNNNIVGTSYVNSGELYASIPGAYVTSGSLPVYVTDPSNGTSATMYVSVAGSSSGSVTLSSLSQTTASVGGSAFTLIVNGSGFSSGVLLNFGTICPSLSTTFVSTGQIYVNIPAYCLATAQTVSITVAGSNGIQFMIGGGSTGGLPITCSPTTGPVSLGVYYSQTCYVSGGTSPYNWTVSGLPAGLSQSAYTGGSSVTITGTPTASQSYSYTVQVSAGGLSGSLTITGTLGSGGTGYSITSLSPSSIPVGSGATNVYVFGNGFSGSSTVYFNGNAVQTTYASSTQLYATIPASYLTTAESASITVNTSGVYSNALTLVIGSGGTSSGSLSVTCSPGVGPQTLSTNYSTTCTATGGIQPYNWPAPVGLPSYLTMSATTGSAISFIGTPSATGPYNYNVKVTDSSFPIQTAVLQIAGQVTTTSLGSGGIVLTSLSPAAAPVNSPTVSLTVNGSGFSTNSQVILDNGFTLVTVYLSSNQLLATIPAGLLTYARAAQITVTTPGAGTSNALTFLVGTGVTGTTSISCSPGVGPSAPNTYYGQTCNVNGGTGPFNWTISAGALPTGLSFSPSGITASVSGYTTFNGPYSYTIQVTDSSFPVNTATAVFAGTTGLGSSTTGGLSLSSVSPNSAAVGSPATTITVNGTGFTSSSLAYFNGANALATTFLNTNQLTAVIPATLLTQAETASITVISSGVTSNAITFTVGTVTSIGITISCTPDIGPSALGSYTTTCTATGGKAPYAWSITNGFLPTGMVLSNSNTSTIMITGLVSVSGSNFTLPYNYTLQVTDSSTPVQQASYPFGGTLSATASGTISSLTPTSAPVGGGQFTLTVTGTGFQSGLSAVYWGGNYLATTFLSPTQLYAIVPSTLLTIVGPVNITVETPGYGVTSQVSFFVSGSSAITVSPSSLSFIYALGGTLPPAKTLSIASSISLTGYSVAVNAIANNITWLSAYPASSTAFPSTISISVAPSGLPIGTYTGSITITGFGVGTGTVIPVTLSVTGSPALVPSSTTLTFTSAAGGTAPTQTLQIAASDGATVIPFTVSAVANNSGSWLTVTPTSGNTPLSLTVTANATSLAAATYSGSITVTPTGNLGNQLSIPVTFTVTAPITLSASPSSLTFNGVTGGSNPAAQTIAVSASGSTAIAYTVAATTASGGSWLSATASGTTPGSISVTPTIANLAAGTYTGTVTITASGASNSPQTVAVTLVVANPPALTSSPQSVTFNYQVGAGGPPTQTLNISAPSGSGPFTYTIAATTSTGGNWLSTSPTTAATPSSVTVSVNASGLQAGTYIGSLAISAPGATSVTVQVTLVVAPEAPTLSVSPQTLTFNATAGGSVPAPQTVAVSTTNSVTANYIVTATSSGQWLSATASGTTPGTISVSVNPANLAVGQYTGSLSIASTGATNTPQTVQVTLNIAAPPSIIANPASLSFLVPGDGSAPAPQSIVVISSGANTNFTAAAISQGGNWLSVTGGGQTPGSILVAVNAAGLFPGQTYNGVVSISAPASNPNTLQVPVTLTLAPQGAIPLQVAPQALYLSYTQGSGSDLQHITVLNNGGGSVNYTVQGGPSGGTQCGNWLNVITPTGTATASSPGVVGIAVNPGGLNPQTCPGVVIINTPNGQTVVPVYMAVSGGTQSILLSQTSMNFVSAANGSAPAPQTFEILNPGSGAMQWTITTSTLAGGSWLSVTPNSGSSFSLAQPGSPINVTVNPQGMAAGVYYGTVQVTSTGVLNSPQSITVSFTVLGSGATGAQVAPAGVILTGINGNSNTQTVNVTNPGSGVLSYSTILTTDDGQSWLTASPSSGSIAAGSTNAISLSATLTGLGTGLRHGTLRLIFSDGSIQTVDVRLALAGASSGAGVHSCGPTDLALEFQSPAQNFQGSAQVAIPLNVLVQDCNGNALTSSNTGVDVLVGSSNTDIRLNYSGNGVWTGTWTPASASPAATLAARAVEIVGSGNANGAITLNGLSGPALPNAPPYVSAVVNAGSFLLPGLVAPGTMVSIFGTGLADGQSQVFSTPFPNSLQGAQFRVRGVPLPLFYASSGQVNAIMPIGLTADVRDQLIVVRDTTQSAPVDLLVADTAPGVFTVNSQGTGQGAVLVGGTSQIAAPVGSIPGALTGPATAGQTVSIFLAGMGTVSNPPADGSPSTGTSLTTVTPVVNIGGVPATVSYSGLAPGEVGLYQLNVLVPAGTMTGNAVPILITIGNETANLVTMAIQ
jgi:uncharacterized protein (TIGR03437 family)